MLKSDIHHVRAEFWIVGGRQVVKSSVHGCLECRRQDARRTEQLMGSLPIHRLTPSLPPFAHTGVNFFRPMMEKVGERGRRHVKRWGCLFKHEGGALGFEDQFEHRSIYDVPKEVQ